MQKTLSFDTPRGTVFSIQYKETGEWYDLEEISLPLEAITECLGIWDDEVVFSTEEGWKLKIPTEVLLKMISETRTLVDDKETSWWNRNKDLHRTFKNLFK